ncbi:uncharacterized protein LOC135955532 [Calliphora vicina]|uniref:uncharacterized protein LOC135955532 n=1 Tax=Calliphora vicina TaxID=7373 RepID=UPI00325AF8DB
MAVCDAKYPFIAASVGSYDSQSDGGIFRMCPFGESVLNNEVPVPLSKPLSVTSTSQFPHYFIGDAAFPLRSNLMRPYPGTNLDRTKTVFNYRLSRARRVIENAFGILAARWRILLTTLECSPDNSEIIVLACIALHNFIMLNDQERFYCTIHFVDHEEEDGNIHEGEWRSLMEVIN